MNKKTFELAMAKVKPKQHSNQPNIKQQFQRPAIDEIKQLGKKYTNLPEVKQQAAKAKIIQLAEKVIYDELQPLFGTAVKKAGTRIAVMLTLGVLLKTGQVRNNEINDFINKALEDKNELLVAEAKTIQ